MGHTSMTAPLAVLLFLCCGVHAAVRPESGEPAGAAAAADVLPGLLLMPPEGTRQPLESQINVGAAAAPASALPRVHAEAVVATAAKPRPLSGAAAAKGGVTVALRPRTPIAALLQPSPPPPRPPSPQPPPYIQYQRPAVGDSEREVHLESVVPTRETAFNHGFYYVIPPKPRAVALMIHGCAHSARNFFPQSQGCPECRGLPEQLTHTEQALRRGYAVIAVNSGNTSTGCWSWQGDCDDVTSLVTAWLTKHQLTQVPLYGLGVSSGASFALKLPRFLRFSGIVAEALAVTLDSWGLQKMHSAYPPTIFVSMLRDEDTVLKIAAAWKELRRRGSPVEVVNVHPRQVYPTYFSRRFPSKISEGLSRKITAALKNIKMVDGEGNVLEDPRYTDRPWLSLLQEQVPELQRGAIEQEGRKALPGWPENEDVLLRGVWSLLNLAYANHEIISDYGTAAFMWFESLGTANLPALLTQFTEGLPPGRQRKALEQALIEEDGEQAGGALASPLWGATVPGEKELFAAAKLAQGQAYRLSHSTNAAEEADLRQWRQAPAVPADLAAAAERYNAQEQLDSDEKLLREAAELEATLEDGGDEGVASSSRQGQYRRAARHPGPTGGSAGSGSSSNSSALDTIVGGSMAGAAVGVVLACLLAALLRKRRLAAHPAGLLAGTVHAAHPAPVAHQHHQHTHAAPEHPSSRLSIIPGVKERFALSEVVEATGSPYSARRRIKTAFSSESPHKNGGL